MRRFLYDLIKNLTTSEKIYFKRNAKVHAGKEDKNYLKIYNAIIKLKSYDKNILPSLFKGTTIEKYLSSEVNYLSEKILISLFNFSLNKSKRNQIHKGILMVEVLASKGFRKEALKKLKELKKSAWKHEEFTWILRLIELEEIILFKQGIIGYKNDLEELHEQRSQIITTIQNLNKYHILRQEIRELQFNEHLFHEDMKALKDFCENPLVQNSENCLSKKAREHWYYINVLTNYLKTDFEAGLNISFEYVSFITENLHLFDSSEILPALSNYVYHAALNTNKKHFAIGEQKLIELSHKKEIPEFYLKYILYTRNLEFSYYANDLNLMEEYLALTSELIKNNLDRFEESQIQYIYLTIIKATIVLGKNDLGMYYCNLWHRRGVLNYRKVLARIYSIMLHFELNYLELIQSEIILLRNLVKSNKRDKKLIHCIYTFFHSIIKYPERKGVLINTFQKDLKSISENNKAFFSFDCYQWSLKLKAN